MSLTSGDVVLSNEHINAITTDQTVFEASLFDDRPVGDVFWVGKVSEGGVVIPPPSHAEALARFRGQVYVHEKRFLTPDSLDNEGRELDEHDKHSTNYGVFERLTPGIVRVVGSGRLINKAREDRKLPIEHHFPEAFCSKPPSIDSSEASRFIARHPDKATQHAIGLAVLRALTFEAITTERPEVYCLVEKGLLTLLDKVIGLPIEQLAEPKQVDELGGLLYPISIKPSLVLGSLQEATNSRLGMATKAFFTSGISTKGIGFFPINLVGQDNGNIGA